jgi:outer membrane protein OmpA-like peptidoglycan-associated protein
MQNPVSESKSTKRKIIRSIWFWILIGLVVFGTLVFILLPVGIDYGIESYLKSLGADEVTLENVDFNPFNRRLTLNDMQVKIGSQTTLKIAEATFIMEWSAFIRKRFVLASFHISDTELIIKALGDGRWQIGGINLPDQKEPSGPSSWNFGLEQVTIRNSIIKFISSQLSSDLKIEQAKISKVSSWMPERKARLEFEGQLNEGNLQIQMDLSPFGNDVMAAGRIKLKGLSLGPFAQLWKPHLKSLEGRLDADLDIDTKQTTETGFSHTQKGRLNLHQVRTQIEDTDFSNKRLAWDGTVHLEIPKSTETLKIAANGRLNGSQFAMASQNENPQIQQEDLTWEGKVNFEQTAGAANLKVDSVLTLQNTRVSAPDVKLAEEKLTWKGTVELSSSGKAEEQRINVNGNLTGGPLTMNLLQEKLNLTHTGLDWQGKFDYAREKTGTRIDTDGQMDLLDVKMDSPELNLAEEKLTWNGAFQFSSTAETDGQRIVADGTLDGGHLLMHLLDGKLNFEHSGMAWKGRLDSGATKDFDSLSAEGDLRLKEVQIHYPQTKLNLLNSGGVALQAIKVKGMNDIGITDVTFDSLDLVTPEKTENSSRTPKPLFSTQTVAIRNIQLTKNKDLSIDTVKLKNLKAAVHRNKEGQFSVIKTLETIRADLFSSDSQKQTPAKQQAKPKTVSKKEPAGFGFRIGQLEITGDNLVRFEDESVSPTFGIDLNILEAGLSNLDSSQPQQPASVKLKISDTEDARISLDGSIQPFAERLSLDWVGKIESFKLVPLSPYVIQNTGYRFIRGEMQADIPLKIKQNELNGAIDLILYNPRVKSVKAPDPEKEKKEKIQLNMPLDSALKLLRDKQNNVKLNIPISGDISDPKFSVADAVNRVLAQTLQASALSYLKFMLGPYGIGISLAEMAFEQASKIRLNPILFAPGSAELDQAAIDYLQRVGAILKEHPKVQVVVCGVATESDRAALSGSPSAQVGESDKADKDKTAPQKEPAASASTDAALLALAKNRSKSIKDQLVKAHAIAVKRIIGCESEIDKGADPRPRADLAI